MQHKEQGRSVAKRVPQIVALISTSRSLQHSSAIQEHQLSSGQDPRTRLKYAGRERWLRVMMLWADVITGDRQPTSHVIMNLMIEPWNTLLASTDHYPLSILLFQVIITECSFI